MIYCLKDTQRSSKELDLFLDDLFELLEPDNKITIGNFLNNKGIMNEYPHYRFVCCLYSTSTALLSEQKIMPEKELHTIRFRTGQNKISFLISYDESKKNFDFSNYISEHFSQCTYIGISSIGLSSTPIGKLYQEADIAMFSSYFHHSNTINQYKPAKLSLEVRQMILNLEISIKELAHKNIVNLLNETCQECTREHLSIEQITIIYNQIVSMIFKYHGNSNVIDEIEHLPYEHIVRIFRSPEQLFERFIFFFEQLTEVEVYIPNEQVKRVIEYIDSCFTEDILLSSIAKKFNISLGYLSSLIKKETGATYSEYVLNKRLSMAKELLNDGSISIHEIVQRVGYKDYFHFNKLFKKNFGLTPSKYRKI